jgi:hypothetical protein
MVAMRVVQMAVDQVVDVVAMRYGLVAAARAVHVAGFVPGAAVGRGADRGVAGADLDHVLIDMVAMGVVQVAVVQVVHVVAVAHGGMAAAGAVGVVVRVVVLGVAGAHGLAFRGGVE